MTLKETPTTLNEDSVEVNLDILNELTNQHQRFVHLYLTGAYSVPKLAQLMDVHPNTIYNWLNKSEIQQAISELQNATHLAVATQLKAMTNKAIVRLTNLMDSPIDGVALQAVKDVLDRGGHKPKQELNINKKVITFEQQLDSLIKKTNPTIDAEYEIMDGDDY